MPFVFYGVTNHVQCRLYFVPLSIGELGLIFYFCNTVNYAKQLRK